MIISLNWLREWIKVDLDLPHLSDLLTTAGLEVSSISRVPEFSNKIRVAEIVSTTHLPGNNNLKICQVDVGQRRNVDIVCGASNVEVGCRVVAAMPGSSLPGGNSIRVADFNGQKSRGMLCSADDLNLDYSADNSAGVLILDSTAPTGNTLNDYLQVDDHIIDIDLTPNRGDCLSVQGIARELHALTGEKLIGPALKSVKATSKHIVQLEIQAPNDAPRYVGRVIDGIVSQSKTPDWMRERLRRCGLRSISTVVDITNYVMLELGQPLHAFDLKEIKEKIVVRRSRKGETLDLLDGKSIRLTPETLMIADVDKCIGMAGIMGGMSSGIDGQTTSIMLEAAYFRPGTIARKAREYGIQSEASYRFERKIDPAHQRTAIERATQLISAFVGGNPGPVFQEASESHMTTPIPITLRRSRLIKVLGHTIPDKRVKLILESLGMKVRILKSGWNVRPPSWRTDIEEEHDLVEEVVRVYGYDNVPTRDPKSVVAYTPDREASLTTDRLTDFLIDNDYQEIMTYSFVDPLIQKLVDPDSQGITLENPIASNMSVMRTSLWPGLLQALAVNYRRQWRRIRLFEAGNVFHGNINNRSEIKRIAGVVTGDACRRGWDSHVRAIDFYDVKGDVEGMFRLAAKAVKTEFKPALHPALHPGQSARITHGSQVVGWLGQLHPEIMKAFDLEQTVFIFELDAQCIAVRDLPAYSPTPKFPSVKRDLSITVDIAIPADDVREVILESGGTILNSIELFDVYQGAEIEKDKKSLSYGLTLKGTSRNLTEQDIEKVMEEILDSLKKKLGSKLRNK